MALAELWEEKEAILLGNNVPEKVIELGQSMFYAGAADMFDLLFVKAKEIESDLAGMAFLASLKSEIDEFVEQKIKEDESAQGHNRN